MTTLMAYSDAVSVRAGETIGFKVSCEGAPRYTARIVRLLSPEAGPDSPPYRTEPVDTPANASYPARVQPLRNGSWAMVPLHPAIAGLRSFSLQAMIWPTLPGQGRQAIMGTWNEALRTGFGLMIGADGTLELRFGTILLSSGVALLTRKWYCVGASYDAATGAVTLWQHLLADRTMTVASSVTRQAHAAQGFIPGDTPLLFAAWQAGPSDGLDGGLPLVGGHFNGKIDSPRLAARALSPADLQATHGGPLPSGLQTALVGNWDFSQGIDGDTIRDTTPNRLHGTTVNLPARAMTGYNWDGSEQSWRHAPQQYGAIHFHDDDLIDARWSDDFRFTVPRRPEKRRLCRRAGGRPGAVPCGVLRASGHPPPDRRRGLPGIDRDLHRLLQPHRPLPIGDDRGGAGPPDRARRGRRAADGASRTRLLHLRPAQ